MKIDCFLFLFRLLPTALRLAVVFGEDLFPQDTLVPLCSSSSVNLMSLEVVMELGVSDGKALFESLIGFVALVGAFPSETPKSITAWNFWWNLCSSSSVNLMSLEVVLELEFLMEKAPLRL